MRKTVLLGVIISFLLSSCSISFRTIETILTAKDVNEVFVRLPIEIVSGYRLAQQRDRFGFVILAPSRRAPDGIYVSETLASQIIWIGWDDDFIVVMEQDETQKVWRIIEVISQHVYDCVENTQMDMCNSYDEFLFLRTQLGISDNLVLKNVGEAYAELSKNK